MSATLIPTRPAAQKGAATTTRRSARRPVGRVIGDIVLAVAVLLIVAPFVYTVVTALRPAADVASDPLGLPTSITFENFANAFTKLDYARGVFNSLVILLSSLLVTVVLGALASYPLARITRSWTAWTYRFFIAGSTVPVFVLIAPLYLLMRDLGMLNSYSGIVLTYTALNLPVAIFFYTSFFRQIPVEVEEAAAIDGAGPVRTFFTILFPLLRPITATLATFLTITIWNDLLVPLVFVQDPALKTVMVNAYSLVGSYTLDPSILFPAALLGVAPLLIVFVVLQRHVVDGLTAGAVKS